MTRRDFSERDIHMALDGEMPAEDVAGYRAWLEATPEMKTRAERFEADRDLLNKALAGVLAEPVPDGLLRAVSGEGRVPARRTALWRAVAAALIFAVGGAGGYVLGSSGWRPGQPDLAGNRFVEQALQAHVLYAAEKLHVVEVGADQSDHLLGWLSKRVGLDLVAPDLTAEGLTFLGGRLLPAGDGKAAQFMYQDGAGNRVSLYVTADKGAADTGFRLVKAGDASAYYWLDDGYGCAIAGSLPQDRLLAVANSAYKQLLGGTPS